ncbi:MAG: hypothetical protein QOD77_1703 [Thermoplasmata archaeon]|jgi:SAM-dependent methyltransferase|nr:hypothetical protein [Thermoplasmata archaeon]
MHATAQTQDPFSDFKAKQRQTWAAGSFADIALFTTAAAGHLVRFAGLEEGQKVLDVATGTGVVAVTAARLGCEVTGLDLTPELLEHAKTNAAVAGVEVQWDTGDAERLPYPDASFDAVVSQFGHMFAPRPEAATAEMLRVLKPGGRIAIATWPPEQLVGKQFQLVAGYLPAPPGVAPIGQWGEPAIVQQRLGDRVRDLHFEHGIMPMQALSPEHYLALMETKNGPFLRVAEMLRAEPAKLAAFRNAFLELARPYHVDNVMRLEYLLTRANKR